MDIQIDLQNDTLISAVSDGSIYAPSETEINLVIQNAQQADLNGLSCALLSVDGETLAHAIISEKKAILNTNTQQCVDFIKGAPIGDKKMAFLAIGDSSKPIVVLAVNIQINPLAEIAPPAELVPTYPTNESLLAILAQMSETAQRVESADATKIAKRAEDKAEVAEQIAKGAQYAKVFATEAEMKTWAVAEMAKPAEERSVKVGDNLYIADTDVPDYWWTGEGVGYSQLETGAVKIEVDNTISFESTNPVQNRVIAMEFHNRTSAQIKWIPVDKADLSFKNFIGSDKGRVFQYMAENDHTQWFAFKNGAFAWQDENGITYIETLGGSHTEVWRGNVGFGEQDTFISGKPVGDNEGQFNKGYPRWHNHGQDIHEVSGFSRDSYENETVWSHRLLLPWDVAKANDTSYLMAAVIWESTRLGVNCKFVQPLLPTNTAEASAALGLPYALPCFENSPIYWNGHLIFDDGSGVKQVQIPWSIINNGQIAKLAIISGNEGSALTMARNNTTKEISIYAGENSGYIGQFRVDKDGGFYCAYKDTVYKFSFVTQAILNRISALESSNGGYAFVNFQYTSSAITLQNKSINIIDCSSATSGSTLNLNVAIVGTSARDFMMVLNNVTDLKLSFYPSLTILPRDGDDSHLVPESGTNVFRFTEIMPKNFLVSRTLVSRGVE